MESLRVFDRGGSFDIVTMEVFFNSDRSLARLDEGPSKSGADLGFNDLRAGVVRGTACSASRSLEVKALGF